MRTVFGQKLAPAISGSVTLIATRAESAPAIARTRRSAKRPHRVEGHKWCDKDDRRRVVAQLIDRRGETHERKNRQWEATSQRQREERRHHESERTRGRPRIPNDRRLHARWLLGTRGPAEGGAGATRLANAGMESRPANRPSCASDDKRWKRDVTVSTMPRY